MPPQQTAGSTTSMDNDVINLAKAIRQTESGGDFNAKGGSGESGAYQWMPGTWKAHAKQALGNENAEMSPSNQNAVAYTVLKSWKDQGLNPAQIAAKWNSGSEVGWENKRGTNSAGIQYDVPKYVKSVTDAYQTVKAGGQTYADPNNPSSVAAPQPEGDGIFKSMAKAIVSPVATMLARPFQAGAELLGASAEDVNKFTKGNFGDWVAPVPQNFGDVKKDIGRGMQTAAMGLGPVSGGAAFGTGMSLEQGNDLFSKETAINTGLGLAGGKLLDLIGRPLLNGAGMVIGKITPQIIKEVAGRGAQATEKFMAQHAILPEGASNLINKGAQTAESVANAPFKAAGNAMKAVGPSSEGMMNRVARLTPKQATDFQKMAGETHGAYLSRTGNFGTPEEIVQNEAIKFANALLEKDAALAKISGTFKSKHLDMIIDDLLAREARIGVPGDEFDEIARLAAKNKGIGLTMEESNRIKQIYEKEVKLGYQKENNTEGIDRATRLDTALRNWQDRIADQNGLKNLKALSKQIQLSKFITDKLGKQIGGKTGNEAINLTDWIILSNGDPTAIAAFLIKKGFSSKGVQASIAKGMAGKPVGPIKAEFGETSGLPATIPGRDYRTTTEMFGPRKPNSVERQAKKINRSSSLKPQLRLPAPRSTAQGVPTILPKSVRETNLGLDEVKNAKINTEKKPQLRLSERAESIKLPASQTSRKKLPQPKSQPKQLGKTYTNSVQEAGEKTTKVIPITDANNRLIDPKEGMTFYHGTIKENKTSLLKEGFNPKSNTKGFAEQPEAFYIGDYQGASMYGDDMVGVRVKNGEKIKTLSISSKEWADVAGVSKNSQESAAALREFRKRGYDAINHGNEIEIINPQKFEIIDATKSKSLYEQVTGKKPEDFKKSLPKASEGLKNKTADSSYRYHETSPRNLESIIKNGIKPNRGQFGKGVYFSPEIGRGEAAGEGLILRIKKDKIGSYNEFIETKTGRIDEGWSGEVVPPENLEMSLDKGKTWKSLTLPKTSEGMGSVKLYRAGDLSDPRGTGIFLSKRESIANNYETTGAGGKTTKEYFLADANLKKAENRWKLIKEIDPKWNKNDVEWKYIQSQKRNEGKLVGGLTAEQRTQAEAEKRIRKILSGQGYDGVEYSGGVTDQGGEYQIFDKSKLIEK